MQSKRGPKERNYSWDFEALSSARLPRRKRVPRDEVKVLLDELKRLVRRKYESDITENLVTAGMHLNKILLK